MCLTHIDNRHKCDQSKEKGKRQTGRKWRKGRRPKLLRSGFADRTCNTIKHQTSRALHTFTLLAQWLSYRGTSASFISKENLWIFHRAPVAPLPWVDLPESLGLEQFLELVICISLLPFLAHGEVDEQGEGLVTAALGGGYPSFNSSLDPIQVMDLGRDVTSVYEHRVLQLDPTLEHKSNRLIPVKG